MSGQSRRTSTTLSLAFPSVTTLGKLLLWNFPIFETKRAAWRAVASAVTARKLLSALPRGLGTAARQCQRHNEQKMDGVPTIQTQAFKRAAACSHSVGQECDTLCSDSVPESTRISEGSWQLAQGRC